MLKIFDKLQEGSVVIRASLPITYCANVVSVTDPKAAEVFMLRLLCTSVIFISCRGYRIRFLRDFNSQKRPKLRTMPTKWWGRVQWWREPIYVAPHVNILQKGPDFTFQDGRPIYVTSLDELERKQEQINLGKQIVKLLSEVNEAEDLYRQHLEAEKEANERRLAAVPSQKGFKEIS